jgi:hypothetical protein
MTILDQAAWNSSADPLLAETGADGTSIAAVAETTVHSALPSSTEVSTELRDSTRALEDDGALSSGTETGAAQSISVKDSSSIVRSRLRTDIPQGEPSSGMGLPQMGSTVAAEHGEQYCPSGVTFFQSYGDKAFRCDQL